MEDDDELHYKGPPQGSMDWLWYKFEYPELGSNHRSIYPHYNAVCKNCNCYGVRDPDENPARCWNCGRFIKKAIVKPALKSKYNRLWG